MKTHLSLIAAALLVLAALPASAQLWGVPGSVGIIDEASASLYEFSGPTLKFKAGATGTIVARYPVTSSVLDPGWSSMRIGYAGTGVTVKVIEVYECLPLQTVITTFGPTTAPDVNICAGHIFGGVSWNFQLRSYYIEVTLTRASTMTNPQIHHIQFP